MTKRIIHLTCNQCRAEFDLDLENARTVCPFCGSRVMIGIDKLLEILAQQEVPVREEHPVQEPFGRSGAEWRYGPAGKEAMVREAPAVPKPSAGTEPDDDAPKWYDPPIEEESEWKQIRTSLFRILVICTPLVIVLKAISGAPVFVIIGVILLFLFLIYLAKR